MLSVILSPAYLFIGGMKVKRTGLWRGLTSLMCFLLALSIIAGNVLEANAQTIDTYMGTQSERMESDGALYDKFVPSADVLNEDGTGNSHALIQKAIDLNRRQAYEGSVLLKNENGVLPLASGANVTLLGIRSHKPVLGSAFGVKVWGPVINLRPCATTAPTLPTPSPTPPPPTGRPARPPSPPPWMLGPATSSILKAPATV